MPAPSARSIYISSKNKRLAEAGAEAELADWVSQTQGFSIAHLKELIISVEVFELSLSESIGRLRAMLKTTPSSTDSDGGIGFTSKG